MLSEGKLEELEKVAREAAKAADGSWTVEDPMDHELSIVQAGKPTHEWRFIAHCPLPDEDEHEAFTGGEISRLAKHIATFDPPTVLALISELRALRVQAALGEACEANGLAGYAPSGEMWFQPPGDWIAEQAVDAALRAQAPAPVAGVVKQRADDDCTICAIAMATGLSYDRVMAVAASSAGGYRYGSTPGTMSPKGVLLDLGYEARRVMFGGVRGSIVQKLLWGRRAILSLPSLNGFAGHHDVYWNGREIVDPTHQKAYAPGALGGTVPLFATLLDERPAPPPAPVGGEVVEALKLFDAAVQFRNDRGLIEIWSREGLLKAHEAARKALASLSQPSDSQTQEGGE